MKRFLILVALLAVVVGVRVASATEPSAPKVEVVTAVATPVAVEASVVPVEAPQVAPAPIQAVAQPVSVPVVVVPVQTPASSTCTIEHASLPPLSYDVSGAVTGRTTLPDGTVFHMVVTVGGVQYLTGDNASTVQYATGLIDPVGHYLSAESHQFWFQPVIRAPYVGPIQVTVTQDGTTVCTATF